MKIQSCCAAEFCISSRHHRKSEWTLSSTIRKEQGCMRHGIWWTGNLENLKSLEKIFTETMSRFPSLKETTGKHVHNLLQWTQCRNHHKFKGEISEAFAGFQENWAPHTIQFTTLYGTNTDKVFIYKRIESG